ncbi:MAG: 3-oxoacyl-[acyl-carrier-protein] reductase FabG [Pseudomonadota bacterium]
MTTTEFKGQVALVTGASRGIGAAIALELAKQGLKVIGTATTDEGAARISDALAAYSGSSSHKAACMCWSTTRALPVTHWPCA